MEEFPPVRPEVLLKLKECVIPFPEIASCFAEWCSSLFLLCYCQGWKRLKLCLCKDSGCQNPSNTSPIVTTLSFTFLLEISDKFTSLFPFSEFQINTAEGFVYEATCQMDSRWCWGTNAFLKFCCVIFS